MNGFQVVFNVKRCLPVLVAGVSMVSATAVAEPEPPNIDPPQPLVFAFPEELERTFDPRHGDNGAALARAVVLAQRYHAQPVKFTLVGGLDGLCARPRARCSAKQRWYARARSLLEAIAKDAPNYDEQQWRLAWEVLQGPAVGDRLTLQLDVEPTDDGRCPATVELHDPQLPPLRGGQQRVPWVPLLADSRVDLSQRQSDTEVWLRVTHQGEPATHLYVVDRTHPQAIVRLSTLRPAQSATKPRWFNVLRGEQFNLLIAASLQKDPAFEDLPEMGSSFEQLSSRMPGRISRWELDEVPCTEACDRLDLAAESARCSMSFKLR